MFHVFEPLDLTVPPNQHNQISQNQFEDVILACYARRKRRPLTVDLIAMAAVTSIISTSSASLFSPTTSQPKTHSLLKHKDHEYVPASSFMGTPAVSLKASRPRTVGIVSVSSRRVSCSSSSPSTLPSALLFDCDGVLVDTEKDGHRISFNETFQEVLYT